MKTMHKAEDVLETYLAQMVSGAPVASADARLETMLRVASRLRQVASVEPSPASVERIRVALQRAPQPEARVRSTAPRLGMWRRPAMGLVFAMLLLTLGTTSALAAPSALPDSPLYSVRNWREAVQVQLAGSAAKRAVLYATFAAERTTQLHRLADGRSADPGLVTRLLRDIEDRVHHANQEAHDDGPTARSAVRDVEWQIGNQLTQIQQQADFSGNAAAQLTETLRAVESGQSGQSGPSGSHSNSNSTINQP
jgi:hypothetical protein